jgi:DNA polymerase I-like protein with 3'-5' exonuclease and polymerase domains
LEAFHRGEDAHNATCKLVFKVDESSPKWDMYRSIAKRLNFAIVYGAGIDVLVSQIELFTGMKVSHVEAEKWWDDMKAAMPEIFVFAARCRSQAKHKRCIELVTGKMRHFAPTDFTHMAMNSKIQGSVAVGMADAMIQMYQDFGPGVVLLQIHDSVVLEPKADEAEEIVQRTKDILNTTFEEYFQAPFKCDSKPFGLKGEKPRA